MISTRFLALPIMGVLTLTMMSGCAVDSMMNIPPNATVASSGNDHLSYTAPSHGRIWIYDVTNDRIDYSGPLATNQAVTVDPNTNSVTIDGRVVSDTLRPGAQHRIYFVAAQNSSSS